MPINLDNVTNITLGNTPVEQVTDSQGNVLWSAAPVPEYFYVEDISGSDNTLSITKNNDSAPTVEVFYSTDQQNWSSMGSTSTTAITATIPANSKLYLKANTDKWGVSENVFNKISTGYNFNVGGNIMSLLYSDNFDGAVFGSNNTYAFVFLFDGSHIQSAANLILPSNTVDYCYDHLFSNSSLTTPPVLPATTMTNVCYKSMFEWCTSLTQAPALPATTLARSCYDSMFQGCSSLTTAPELPATTLARSCYYGMFSGCISLTQAPVLPATTLVNDCYTAMFLWCTSLTTAPTLPATTLANTCYGNMFQGCTSLTTAPALPATTLYNGCYQNMFYGCTKLNKVTTYAQNISASYYTNDWLDSVSSTGTFYNMACTTYPSGASGIPAGWTELHTLNDTINVTITNTGNYTGATYQIDSGTAQPINETGTTSFTVPVTATTLTIHRNGKGVTDVLGICGYSEDSHWDAAFPVGKMTDNVSIDIMSLM